MTKRKRLLRSVEIAMNYGGDITAGKEQKRLNYVDLYKRSKEDAFALIVPSNISSRKLEKWRRRVGL